MFPMPYEVHPSISADESAFMLHALLEPRRYPFLETSRMPKIQWAETETVDPISEVTFKRLVWHRVKVVAPMPYTGLTPRYYQWEGWTDGNNRYVMGAAFQYNSYEYIHWIMSDTDAPSTVDPNESGLL